MAGYTGGGGGGGASVVPASLVVASERADFPLTEQGLIDAIADLPAEGGYIYLGEGTLTITAGSIVTGKNIKLIGAGRGTTILSLANGITAFNLGAFQFLMRDVQVVGNATQKLILLTAAGSVIDLQNCRIGVTAGFGGTELATFLDCSGSSWSSVIKLLDCQFDLATSFIANGNNCSFSADMCAVTCTGGTISLPAATYFNGARNCTFSATTIESRGIPLHGCMFSGTISILAGTLAQSCTFLGATTFGTSSFVSDCTVSGAVTAGDTCVFKAVTMSSTLSAGDSSVYVGCTFNGAVTASGNGQKFTGCIFSSTLTLNSSAKVSSSAVTGAVVAGSSCQFTNVSMSSTLSAGASSIYTGCTAGAVTAAGASVTMVGCTLTTFSSTSLNGHQIKDCIFTGNSTTVTLASSSSCRVGGNVNALVVETGSSDSNTYNSILNTSDIIGASSVITDLPIFSWVKSGDQSTTDDAAWARPSPQVATMVRLIKVTIETAPTGATLIVSLKRGTVATGAIGATLGTATIAIGAFTATATIALADRGLAPTEFIVPDVTQIGSTIPGANITIEVFP